LELLACPPDERQSAGSTTPSGVPRRCRGWCDPAGKPSRRDDQHGFNFRRRQGEALHPDREPFETLDRIWRMIGEYNFAGQYQQSPAPLGGRLVKARIIQVAGSSQKSIEDAIQNAVGRASSTLCQVGWFEVVETRGHVEDGRVAHYQVTLKIGFTLDDD
jgi:flavin-binding protein dodecin